MDIIDQLYNSHVSTAALDALDQYRVHKDQALHGYHALKEQLTDDQVAALDQVMDENLTESVKSPSVVEISSSIDANFFLNFSGL